jgi:hypothetical protein
VQKLTFVNGGVKEGDGNGKDEPGWQWWGWNGNDRNDNNRNDDGSSDNRQQWQ